MTPTTPPSPPERLAALIEGLCAAVAAHGARGLLTLPLLLLLWSRLRRMATRARLLSTRLAAGAPLTRPAKPRATPRAAPAKPYIRLPRGLTWLVRAVPGTAVGAATLRHLLDDPAMAELARAAPIRRLLNPLCRMLGVQPPPPSPPPAPPPAPPPRPVAGAPSRAAPPPREPPPPGPARATLAARVSAPCRAGIVTISTRYPSKCIATSVSSSRTP